MDPRTTASTSLPILTSVAAGRLSREERDLLSEVDSRPLRIGIIAPPWFAIPPTGYGGIERVVSYLADGLADRGHDVTLFAPGTSSSSAKIRSTFDEPQPELLGDVAVEAWHVLQASRTFCDFDIIHDHSRLGLLALDTCPIPVVHTIHGLIRPQERRLYSDIGRNASLVAISAHQRSFLPEDAPASVIYNAVDLATAPFNAWPGDYLLFVGRMSPDKGIVEAIEIAHRAGMRLKIIAKINEPCEHEYFAQVVRPALRGVDHELLEQPPEQEKLQAYAGARALLFPIRWDEPFGLVMIEAMATGTPVIGFRRGSVPEVVVHGRTGIIVDDVDDAIRAVERVHLLDRRHCRDRVRERFSTTLSVVRHEQLYRRRVAEWASPGSGAPRRTTQEELTSNRQAS